MPMSFVQGLANCRIFGVGTVTKGLRFQPLAIGASIAFYLTGL